MLLNAFYAVWFQIVEVLEVICILEIQDQQLDIPILNRKTDLGVHAGLGLWGIFCFTPVRNFRMFMLFFSF